MTDWGLPHAAAGPMDSPGQRPVRPPAGR
jgi:hypothetical protein